MSAITRMLKPCLGSTEELYSVVGRCQIGSDGYEDSDDLIGASVALTGVGQYTITFASDAKPSAVRSVSVSLMAATAVDLVAQVKSISTSAIVVKTLTGATATTPSAACELLIHIDCRKTGVAR